MDRARDAAQEISKLLEYGDLTFRDFVEVALYHPLCGYYSRPQSPVGREGDYVTNPTLSPAFSFTIGKLVAEFLSRAGDSSSTVVDIGCGDGALIHTLAGSSAAKGESHARFFGVDRSLERVPPEFRERVTFVRTIEEVPRGDAQLVVSNELFDAIPFARLVMRDGHLHELRVTSHDGTLEWSEAEAAHEYEDYFGERGIELQEGQFADVALEWQRAYADLLRFVVRGLVVTFDYGYRERQLFSSRARRFGTAAAYRGQRVSRDLLASPGSQDLTAHINFDDLIRAGEGAGFRTLFFERQAKFLLSVGITEHPLFTPSTDVAVDSMSEAVDLIARREEARRLVLPDDIGHDIRVLVQERGMGESQWSFERRLF